MRKSTGVDPHAQLLKSGFQYSREEQSTLYLIQCQGRLVMIQMFGLPFVYENK